MGYYVLRRMLIAGPMAFLVTVGTMPYAAHAGDTANADDAATNPMIREIMKDKPRPEPCSAGRATCGSASQPTASGSGQPGDDENGGVKKRRPIPRRNFSDSVKNAPEPDCNEMNSGGMLMHGHWDSTKFKCVYDEPTIRFPAPHAKFN